MSNDQTKLIQLAHWLNGQVLHAQAGLEINVTGLVDGFPVTLKAIKANYPFSTTYFLDISSLATKKARQSFKLTILPRYMHGWLSFISRLVLFEGRGQRMDMPKLDSILLFKSDNIPLAKQFIHSPGVAEDLLSLEQLTKFNEIIVKSDIGLYLSQPQPFATLNLETCKQVFKLMTKIAQLLFENYI